MASGRAGIGSTGSERSHPVPGQQDANIKLLYATGENSFCTADTVANGAAFDVVANVEIGRDLRRVVTKEDLFVSIVNRSQAVAFPPVVQSNTLVPGDDRDALCQELRVKVDPGWPAAEGDVLQIIATYKVTAGVFTDYSTATSADVIVCA
jgi:hypothetical protein